MTARRADMPHGLRQLADAAGADAALTIGLARGGSRFRIPKKADGSDLADLVGIDAARAIVSHLADERIEIPLAAELLNAWLRDEHGWSQERRAMRLRKSRRTIQYWDSGATPSRADPTQSDLFGT